MERGMNILIVARADHSGAGYALKQAVEKCTKHKVRTVCFKRGKLQYPYDVFNPSKQKLRELINWADVVNLHDEALQLVGPGNKPVVTTYHGSWYRGQYKQINQRDKQMGFKPTCLTIDLSIFGPKFIGRSHQDLSAMWKPEKFTVIHAPTQRHRKGTKAVLKANVNVQLIEGVTNAECLKRKAKASVLIDQVGSKALGYGTNAVEAWALGMPVISFAPQAILDEMKKQWGYIPFVAAGNAVQIREEVMLLKEKEAYYNAWQQIGRAHFEKHHSQEAVAKEFVKVCNAVL